MYETVDDTNIEKQNKDVNIFFCLIVLDEKYLENYVDNLILRTYTMNNKLHLLIATTLSMIMTSVLYNCLRDTRAIDSYFQRAIIDTTRDSILFVRCEWNSEKSKFI